MKDIKKCEVLTNFLAFIDYFFLLLTEQAKIALVHHPHRRSHGTFPLTEEINTIYLEIESLKAEKI